jgi:hypothetical protein
MLVCAKPYQADTCLAPTQRAPLPIAVGSACRGEFDLSGTRLGPLCEEFPHLVLGLPRHVPDHASARQHLGCSGSTSKITESAENKSSADSPTSTRSPPEA